MAHGRKEPTSQQGHTLVSGASNDPLSKADILSNRVNIVERGQFTFSAQRRTLTCRKTPPLEICSWLANSLAICVFAVDSWIPRPLVEFLGPQSKLVGPGTVTRGRPCSRSARKFWCCPRFRKCSRCCMQGWTTLRYRRTLGNCARKLCSEIQKTGCLPWAPAILHARFATSVGSGRCLEFAQKNLGGGLACKV